MPTPEPQPHRENGGNNGADAQTEYRPPRQSGFWKNPNHWVAIATVVIAVANALYTFFALQQWNTMQGQLDQMKSSSAQTERLISETHTLAQNAGAQATNAADQVKKLAVMAEAANKQAAALGGQLSVMQSQLESGDRPWISVTMDITDGLHFDQSKKAILKLKYTLQNTGRSTAVGIVTSLVVRTLAAMPVEMGNWDKPLKEQVANCSTLEKSGLPDGAVLFPGQTREGIYPWWTIAPKVPSRSTHPTIPDRVLDDFGNEFRLVVFGCVDYRYAASTRHHQTGFAYEVRFMRGPNNYGPLFIGVDAGLENLKLHPYWLGGFYAN